MDAPGSHLTYGGRCKRVWVSPAAWCTVPRGLSGPRLATGRPGSSPSPWHGKVDVSASAAVNMLGRVCLCAPGPWGHCKAIRRRVGGFMAVHHTLKPPARAGFGLLCTLHQIWHFRAGVFGVWRWNGGLPRVTKGIAGCPRTPLDLPWAFDAGVGPSYCMVHRCVSSAGTKIGDRPCRKFAFPMAREGGWVGHDRSTHVGAGLPVSG